MKIILCGHGRFASGLLSASDMIYGRAEATSLDFLMGKSSDELLFELDSIVCRENEEKDIQPDSILFLVDIFAGTPYNVISKFVLNSDIDADIISGINLPVLIEALSAIRTNPNISLLDMVDLLKDVAGSTLEVFTERIKEVTLSSDKHTFF